MVLNFHFEPAQHEARNIVREIRSAEDSVGRRFPPIYVGLMFTRVWRVVVAMVGGTDDDYGDLVDLMGQNGRSPTLVHIDDPLDGAVVDEAPCEAVGAGCILTQATSTGRVTWVDEMSRLAVTPDFGGATGPIKLHGHRMPIERTVGRYRLLRLGQGRIRTTMVDGRNVVGLRDIATEEDGVGVAYENRIWRVLRPECEPIVAKLRGVHLRTVRPEDDWPDGALLVQVTDGALVSGDRGTLFVQRRPSEGGVRGAADYVEGLGAVFGQDSDHRFALVLPFPSDLLGILR